jgi:anti-anti-sigma factor
MDMVTSRSARILVDIHWHGDQATVAVLGEIDFFTAPALSVRLDEVIDIARPRRLIVDLAGVPFLDCAGARAVAGARAALPECCQMVLCSLRPSLVRSSRSLACGTAAWSMASCAPRV